MAQKLEIFDLSLDPPSHIPADELLPSNDLESDLLTSVYVDGEFDFSEGPLSKGPDGSIGADALLSLDLFAKGTSGAVGPPWLGMRICTVVVVRPSGTGVFSANLG